MAVRKYKYTGAEPLVVTKPDGTTVDVDPGSVHSAVDFGQAFFQPVLSVDGRGAETLGDVRPGWEVAASPKRKPAAKKTGGKP